MDKPTRQTSDVAAALIRAYPELTRIVAAAADTPLYIVGGAIRDLLAGRGRTDLDIAVDGDPLPMAVRLDPEAVVNHDRFQTASITVDGLAVDLARTRRESYQRPGALPDVEPAPIEDDLARRDFSVNAMAIRVASLARPTQWRLIDPFDGVGDLASGRLRLLHQHSIRDDPTRALRGARYAAVYDLRPVAATAAQLAATDLGTVSWQRRRADLLRIAATETAGEAFALLEGWGAAALRPGWQSRMKRVRELLSKAPWHGCLEPAEALVAAVWPEAAAAVGDWQPRQPETPAEIVAEAGGRGQLQLLLARADGAAWLDEYMSRLRRIRLEIGGDDLIAAGIEPGPAIGRGLKAALERKLNGEIIGREAELKVALAAAGTTCHD